MRRATKMTGGGTIIGPAHDPAHLDGGTTIVHGRHGEFIRGPPEGGIVRPTESRARIEGTPLSGTARGRRFHVGRRTWAGMARRPGAESGRWTGNGGMTTLAGIGLVVYGGVGTEELRDPFPVRMCMCYTWCCFGVCERLNHDCSLIAGRTLAR